MTSFWLQMYIENEEQVYFISYLLFFFLLPLCIKRKGNSFEIYCILGNKWAMSLFFSKNPVEPLSSFSKNDFLNKSIKVWWLISAKPINSYKKSIVNSYTKSNATEHNLEKRHAKYRSMKLNTPVKVMIYW